jgi:hypothetical protein
MIAEVAEIRPTDAEFHVSLRAGGSGNFHPAMQPQWLVFLAKGRGIRPAPHE